MQLTHKATFGKAGLALALLTAGSLTTVARPAAAQHVYDASADFSTTNNPSPAGWRRMELRGAETTLGSTHSHYTLDAVTGSGQS